jgi:uncharacterized protein
MKLALLLLIVLFAAWLWRSRRQTTAPKQRSQAKPATPQDMVACLHCGTHLPAVECISGQRGAYCSEEHRLAAES